MINPNTIQELLVAMAWVTPVLIALVGVIRSTFKVADRYVPLLSVVLGIGAGLLLVEFNILGGVVGVIIGLSASGLYDVGKKTLLNT